MKKFDLHNDPKITSGFKTPDAYFEKSAAEIMAKLPVPESGKVIALPQRKVVWMSGIAASLLLVSGLSVYYFAGTPSTWNLDDAVVESYLQANVNSFDIIQHLDEKDIKELEKSIVLSDDAVESYLSDNNNLDLYLNE